MTARMDTVLFDGHCRMCAGAAKALVRWVPPDRVRLRSFREEGALEPFPQVTEEQCERAMQYVRADGRVFQGAEAIVQALRHRPLGKLAAAYYAPGLRQLLARRRFKLASSPAASARTGRARSTRGSEGSAGRAVTPTTGIRSGVQMSRRLSYSARRDRRSLGLPRRRAVRRTR